MSLSHKISALTTAFAAEVVRALRSVPVQELAALSGKRLSAPPAPQTIAARPAARPVAVKVKAKAKAKANHVKGTAPPLDRQAVSAALDFFVDRGRKGATGVQVLEHLRISGFVSGTAEVLSDLAASGAIRDAGIRRATGKGTAPVYVDSAVRVERI